MSKQNNGNKTKAKKGMVVNRKHNRTIPQDVANADRKWKDIGNGILQLKSDLPTETAFIKMVGNKHRSVSADGSHDYNPEGTKRLGRYWQAFVPKKLPSSTRNLRSLVDSRGY